MFSLFRKATGIEPPKPEVFKVDWFFIRELEGFLLQGYVPMHRDGTVIGQSGVTVATGFDIGTRNEQDLRKLNLSEGLFHKLLPYVGLRKEAAVAALRKTPLRLTNQEAVELDEACKKDHMSQLERQYNNVSKVPFKALPEAAQTVIASVSFQYGVGLSRRTPRFWQQAVTHQWDEMYKNLLNFGDAYARRRQKEADYLYKYLIAKGTKT